MQYLNELRDRANITILKYVAATGGLLLPGIAKADVSGQMVDAVCRLIGPLVGRSKVVSLVFLVALGVMVFLWWLSESKEGIITWILRTGIALGVLINIFTLPTLLGLPPVCSGF